MEITTNPEARAMTYYGPVCNHMGGFRVTSCTNGEHTDHLFSTLTAARNFLRAARAAAAA